MDSNKTCARYSTNNHTAIKTKSCESTCPPKNRALAGRGAGGSTYLTDCDSLSDNVILICPHHPSRTWQQLPLPPLHGSGRLGAQGPQPQDAEEDERGLPRRKAATAIDTATAEEDVEDFHVPEKNLTGFDQVLLLSALCKQVRDEVQAQSQSLTSRPEQGRVKF